MVDRIARALAERLGRATEQGFDVGTTLYHGTSKDNIFTRFNNARHGTWTTTDPAEASAYAKMNDSQRFVPGYDDRGRPTYVPTNTASRVLPLYGRPLQNPFVVQDSMLNSGVPDFVQQAGNYKGAQSNWFDQLRSQGYDGVLYPGGTRVDFNNANLRSTFAPFDPANADKAKIVGGLAGAAALGSMFDPSQYPTDQDELQQ